jgi:hypothetical protein
MVVENFPASPIHASSSGWTPVLYRHHCLRRMTLVCVAMMLIASTAGAYDCSGHGSRPQERTRPGGIEGRLGYYQPILPTRSFYAPPSVQPGWREGYRAGFHDGQHASPRQHTPRARGWGADSFRPSGAGGHSSRAREGFAWRQGYRD